MANFGRSGKLNPTGIHLSPSCPDGARSQGCWNHRRQQCQTKSFWGPLHYGKLGPTNLHSNLASPLPLRVTLQHCAPGCNTTYPSPVVGFPLRCGPCASVSSVHWLTQACVWKCLFLIFNCSFLLGWDLTMEIQASVTA